MSIALPEELRGALLCLLHQEGGLDTVCEQLRAFAATGLLTYEAATNATLRAVELAKQPHQHGTCPRCGDLDVCPEMVEAPLCQDCYAAASLGPG